MRTFTIPSTPRSEETKAAIAQVVGTGIGHHCRIERDGKVDCLGGMLAIHAARACGLMYDQTPFNQPYTIFWFRSAPRRLRDGLLGLGWSETFQLEEMDVALAATLSPAGDHPLVYVGESEILHAWRGASKVIVEPLRVWMPKITVVLRPMWSNGCQSLPR